MSKPALGRGLGALLGGSPAVAPPPTTTSAAAPSAAATAPTISEPAAAARDRVQRVPVDRIRPCPLQPRKDFPDASLHELADSIREQGVVQPLIVRTSGDAFEIIAGERRWRAAQIAGVTELPVIVREADDRMVLELALIENLQRENLNPIEEAQGYAQLVSQFQLTQEEVASKVGRSRAVVANALRLLKLTPQLQAFVRDGRLSVGHAKVILGLARGAEQELVADRVLRRFLNVRQTEQLVAQFAKPAMGPGAGRRAVAPGGPTDSQISDLERRLQERLGTKVDLRYRQGKGSIQIHFYSDEDLERVLEIVGARTE